MSESLLRVDAIEAPPAPLSPVQRLGRWLLHSALQRIERGEVELDECGEKLRFGRPGSELPLRVRVKVHDPECYAGVALGGSLGAGESFVRGEWSCDDPAVLVRILVRNREALGGLDSRLSRLGDPLRRLLHALRRNSRRGSRRNIAAHYDLGNDFFALFLDPTLTYSAGIFERPECSLEEASKAKYERICSKLSLGPGDRVLEIGSGWGGFALHAAATRGCRITTTTLSERQYEVARERVAAAGLGDRVTVLLEDYRELRGSFDKLASIEMIEAVGHQYYETYFRVCAERLAPHGLAAIQAITIADSAYEQAKEGVDFIKRHIFPGGCIPSLSALAAAAARVSDLRLVHLEDITPHYAETLRRWRQRFLERRDEALALGYGEDFLRMWEYYLAYCEGGFEERHLGSLQMVFARPLCRRPPILGRLSR